VIACAEDARLGYLNGHDGALASARGSRDGIVRGERSEQKLEADRGRI